MKLTIIFIAFAFSSFSFDRMAELPDVEILSTTFDAKIDSNQAKFTFYIGANSVFQSKYVSYSDNDSIGVLNISDEGTVSILTSPGIHRFQFLLQQDFYEIETDKIQIKEHFHTIANLNFKLAEREIMVRKPVIYLYPQEEMEVDVEINPIGELFFTYPKYEDGWNVNAKPNGEIIHNEQQYNYLFWESSQSIPINIVDFSTGSIVAQKDILSFIENTLNEFGFTSKERADFITYWIPLLKHETNVYIYIKFNDACDEFATLNISPKPDNIGRFYMLWAPVGEHFNNSKMTPQVIQPIERNGFTVLEWGGLEIEYKPTLNKSL